jgi:hypothetical protein
MLYPISWGLSEGGNVIHVDSETVFYGILDLFSQILFALALVGATRDIDFDRMGLEFTEYGRIHDNEHWKGGEKGGVGRGTGPAQGSAAGTDGAGGRTEMATPGASVV